jgi:NADH-quinone oxidoreductase subunit D
LPKQLNYDRFHVRFREMMESKRIIEQAMRQIPAGPVNIDDHRYILRQRSGS